MSRELLLLSTTTIHGTGFMDYCIDEVAEHFKGIKEIVFVPYARPSGISHDQYTEIVTKRLSKIGIKVRGIHTISDPFSELSNFQGIYIGGGNTFLLLNDLYRNNLVEVIRDNVLEGNMRYMGSSAGTNVACVTINNTNDMPIVHPPTFEALGLISFNINPHYLDPDPTSKHNGETRETRINEFHFQSEIPVLGLREGSWLNISGDKISLGGMLKARLFQQGKPTVEVSVDDNLSFLLH